MNNSYIASEIKGCVKMNELLQFYGLDVRRSRIKCPFHNGEDYNCGVKRDYVHCFVCGESADAVGFVMRYFGLSFKEATAKLNNDFNLGLPTGEKLDRRREIDFARKAFKAKQEREKKNEEHNRLKKAREDAIDEWVRLDKQRMKYKPKSEGEDLHPLFVEAIIKLPRAEIILDCVEMELYLYETSNSSNT